MVGSGLSEVLGIYSGLPKYSPSVQTFGRLVLVDNHIKNPIGASKQFKIRWQQNPNIRAEEIKISSGVKALPCIVCSYHSGLNVQQHMCSP